MFFQKVSRLFSLSLYDQWNFLVYWWYRAKGRFLYRWFFGSFGKGSAIYAPTLVGNPKAVHIGDRVVIRQGVRIEAVVTDPSLPPEIFIGNDVNIEQDVHIVAIGKIHIRDKVSITARSSLLCGGHPFFDVHSPIKIGDRLTGAGSFIEIGEGSFLGIGSVIQMNVRLGKHVIVGAGAVVKKSVPDYCVVDGNPAKIALQYDAEKDRWIPPAAAKN